jgi:hypothetical protein
MVVTPFGDFDLEDEIALERFLDAHSRRHHVYSRAAGVPGGTLRSPVNGDWMARHAARHVALATKLNLRLTSADTKVLALPGKWRTQHELIDWTDLHHRLHVNIDRLLKIT